MSTRLVIKLVRKLVIEMTIQEAIEEGIKKWEEFKKGDLGMNEINEI